ncbi:thiaminase /4-amino-5-aminomethyl-2-methylpyrimidine deaminase [Tenacibaculum adriaticum]|uniref:Aminopyrimidine aminohydrolase n=1 Tax=Tenacibaculum adriaticum TaxID=413713 RepID=A0A5S5DX63_9FLAO|nr:thiaminase II [Tenacibaculum adriaticum]TYP99209.1 thiaminase /4-amino-5-aminomethyl-2-methylpyrimidine deaminase [Tenacibaculum adriaticum]
MTWSKQTWKKINPIYQSIIEMPFITELMNGTLPMEKFQFYMMQDAGYLEHFGKALALIAAKTTDVNDSLSFIRFAETAIVVESALHEVYFKDFGIRDKGKMEPACHHYVHYVKCNAALAPIEVAIATVLPCFWIYKKVGEYIFKNQKSKNNPYQKWIDTYAGEEFEISVQKAIEICDRVAENSTKANRQAMTEAFITASHLEFNFWDAAYKMKKW